MRKPIVVAVAAVTAGGKTTTVHALAERLPGARALYFDDYSFPGNRTTLACGWPPVRTIKSGIWSRSGGTWTSCFRPVRGT